MLADTCKPFSLVACFFGGLTFLLQGLSQARKYLGGGGPSGALTASQTNPDTDSAGTIGKQVCVYICVCMLSRS